MVRGEYGEKLIPFVSHYIDGVDAENRKITADWGVDYDADSSRYAVSEMFHSIVEYGVTGQAHKQNLWQFSAISPRQFADNKLGYIDDRPFGGGAGMVMMAGAFVQGGRICQTKQPAACLGDLFKPAGRAIDTQKGG